MQCRACISKLEEKGGSDTKDVHFKILDVVEGRFRTRVSSRRPFPFVTPDRVYYVHIKNSTAYEPNRLFCQWSTFS